MSDFVHKVEKLGARLTGPSLSEPTVSAEKPQAFELEEHIFPPKDPVNFTFQAPGALTLVHLTSAGLSPPKPNVLTQAQIADGLHEDALHIPKVLVPELHPDAIDGAGTAITVGIFNAAFLPMLPIVPPRQTRQDGRAREILSTSEPEAEEAMTYFASFGLNGKRLDWLKRIAKHQISVLIWLSAFTKTAIKVLQVLRRESSENPISYEDEARETSKADEGGADKKTRRILKI